MLPNYERTLTGRARVRCGWFGRMVLQVEVSELRYSACPPMPGSDPQAWRQQMRAEGETFLFWRDATWEDLQGQRFDLGHAAGEPPHPMPAAPAPSLTGWNVNQPPHYPKPPAPPAPPAPLPVRRYPGPWPP